MASLKNDKGPKDIYSKKCEEIFKIFVDPINMRVFIYDIVSKNFKGKRPGRTIHIQCDISKFVENNQIIQKNFDDLFSVFSTNCNKMNVITKNNYTLEEILSVLQC